MSKGIIYKNGKAVGEYDSDKPIELPKIRGLGDLLHIFAYPAAKIIDTVTGTDLQNCGGCAQRREDLNKKLPFQ